MKTKTTPGRTVAWSLLVAIALTAFVAVQWTLMSPARSSPPVPQAHVETFEPELRLDNVRTPSLRVTRWTVVDGDTIEIDVPSWPALFRPIGVRILWIDAPETRTKDPVEKKAGLASKAHLERLVAGADELLLTDVKRDKFFRLDARVSANGVDLSNAQVKAGHAKPWNGDGPRP